MSKSPKRHEIYWEGDAGMCGAYGTPEELARALGAAKYTGPKFPLFGDDGRVVAFVSANKWSELS